MRSPFFKLRFGQNPPSDQWGVCNVEKLVIQVHQRYLVKGVRPVKDKSSTKKETINRKYACEEKL